MRGTGLLVWKPVSFWSENKRDMKPISTQFNPSVMNPTTHVYYSIENTSKSMKGSFIAMEEWTIKTPNPICRLFFKIDLLTDFAAIV